MISMTRKINIVFHSGSFRVNANNTTLSQFQQDGKTGKESWSLFYTIALYQRPKSMVSGLLIERYGLALARYVCSCSWARHFTHNSATGSTDSPRSIMGSSEPLAVRALSNLRCNAFHSGRIAILLIPNSFSHVTETVRDQLRKTLPYSLQYTGSAM